MNVQTININQWSHAEDYAICVHHLKDSVIHDIGLRSPKHVRSVRILVKYVNSSKSPLNFRLSQWLLFDTDGFSYEFELRNQFYEDDVSHKLR
ncbi:MAG: hypothetical protein B6242_01825 [Anaerolineaceae bacterium 4572_78]|nr:MAG: hypothetical protein B6242_01825 [Anaerolineaceae bacterium 4572_78]